MTMRRLSLVTALFLINASGAALAEPCPNNTEAVKQAVEDVAKAIGEHGMDFVAQNLFEDKGKTICGIGAVAVIDHSGTWRVSPAAPEYIGKNITSLGDGAATNFFKGIIQGAIESKGRLISYFTKDTERGVVINKSLYFIDVPSRKMVVYGAFASK